MDTQRSQRTLIWSCMRLPASYTWIRLASQRLGCWRRSFRRAFTTGMSTVPETIPRITISMDGDHWHGMTSGGCHHRISFTSGGADQKSTACEAGCPWTGD